MAPLLRFKALLSSTLLLFVPTLLYLSSNGPPSASHKARRRNGGGGGLRYLGGGWGHVGPLSSMSSSAGVGLPSFAHLRVIVRTHPPELLHLRSLIYGLRAAAESRPWLRLDFVLVPTEPGAGVTYDRLQRELNPNFGDVRVLQAPDSFYEQAKARNPYKCTLRVRARYQGTYKKEEVHKYCDFEHYMYYAATDRALAEWVAPCDTCTHVLVTNGDNGYAPDFFDEAFQRPEDLVVVPFVHEGEAIARPVLGIGGMDLGGVLMRKRAVVKEGEGGEGDGEGGGEQQRAYTFMGSLPENAGPKEVHDADYWFVRRAVDRGMSYALLSDRVLMYHH